MPTISLTVWCDVHRGVDLTAELRDAGELYVRPCPKCIKDAYDEGHDKGVDHGYEKGKQDFNNE